MHCARGDEGVILACRLYLVVHRASVGWDADVGEDIADVVGEDIADAWLVGTWLAVGVLVIVLLEQPRGLHTQVNRLQQETVQVGLITLTSAESILFEWQVLTVVNTPKGGDLGE